MRTTLTALTLAALITACSGGHDSPPPPPPTTGAIRLSNSASYAIDETYVSPSANSSWGAMRNSTAIQPSASFTVTDLSPGVWDLKAVINLSQSPYLAFASDVDVAAGLTAWLVAYDHNFSGSLRVTNGSTYTITGLYVVNSGATTWGNNQLGTSTIASGSSFMLYGIPAGAFDVECAYSNGATSAGTWTVAPFSVTSISCN